MVVVQMSFGVSFPLGMFDSGGGVACRHCFPLLGMAEITRPGLLHSVGWVWCDTPPVFQLWGLWLMCPLIHTKHVFLLVSVYFPDTLVALNSAHPCVCGQWQVGQWICPSGALSHVWGHIIDVYIKDRFTLDSHVFICGSLVFPQASLG